MKIMQLLSLSDLDADSIQKLAQRAVELSELWQDRTMPKSLTGRRVGLIAELPGWRNPTALELGVTEMGGICVAVNAKLEGVEIVGDLAGYLGNWFDLMAIRTPRLSRLREFSEQFAAPVLNLRTNDNHPCEVLGDLSFILSERNSLDGLRVSVVAPAGNIARSWLEAAHHLPIHITQVTPAKFAFNNEELGSQCETTDDLAAIYEADVIVTDCWPRGIDEGDNEAFGKLQITAEVLNDCHPDVAFIPCPPVTRGEEVCDSAMEHGRCLSTQAKAFLAHAQNAFIEAALKGNG